MKQNKKRSHNEQKRRLSVKKRVIIAAACVVVLLAGLAGGGLLYGYRLWQTMYKPMADLPVVSSQTEEIKKQQLRPHAYAEGDFPELTLVHPAFLSEQKQEDFMNIMLTISDGYGNGDLMLLTLDKQHKQVKFTAFLGQTWVKIPGLDLENQLDRAHAAGGVKLAAQTLEQNFGVTINRYIEINSQQIPQIIDGLGGVELTLSDAEASYINEYSGNAQWLQGAGTYHLTGAQAVCHAGNHTAEMHDFDTISRKRDVIMAAFNRFQTNGDMVQLVKLITDSSTMMSTDLELDEITDLLKECLSYSDYEVAQYLLPGEDNYQISSIDTPEGSKEVLLIQDIDKVRQRLQGFVYGDYHESDVFTEEQSLYHP